MSVGWATAPGIPAARGGVVYRDLRPHNAPAWTDLTSAGPWTLNPGNRFDRHYHDCHEYWLIASGSAVVEVEPDRVLVRPGDILCIERGRAHTVVALRAPLEAFWVEGPVVEGGQVGSLHYSEADARGREIPLDSGALPSAPAAGLVWGKLGGGEGPAWLDLVAAELSTLEAGEQPAPLAPGSDEYWLVVSGSARVALDGEEHEVGAGDVVCLERGRARQLAELFEPLRYFRLERRRP
jgi:mannose-6-phosphate isomerase-like protein (cupin superfamily)